MPIMSNAKKKPLTDSDKANAARLKSIWMLKKNELGLTQEKAAHIMGFGSQGAVSHYLNGIIALNVSAILKFSSMLEVDPLEISTDFNYGHLHHIADPSHNNVSQITHKDGNSATIRKVPLISWVSAGEWVETVDSYNVGDAEEMMFCPVNHSNSTFALRVEGDSMTNPLPGQRSYPHGTIIYIDPSRHAELGDRVVAKLEDDNKATFKILAEDAGQRFLKPLNPQYRNLEINGNCRIVGKVIGAFTPE